MCIIGDAGLPRQKSVLALLAPLTKMFYLERRCSLLKLSNKKELVAEFAGCLRETQISILVDYKGLNVESMTQLRAELRKEGVRLAVVKNTLLGMASEGTDTALLKDFFKGPNAIATCADDPVAPARILVKFAETNSKLEIKAGVMNGKILTVEDIKALAKMPSREVLLAQLLSAMNGVPTALVRVLSGVPRGFMTVLNAIGEQKEAA